MFDLFRSREKTVRYVLTGVLSLVALSLVITLIPGYGGPSRSSREDLVAEIGNESVTALEVRRLIQRDLQGRKFTPDMASLYVPIIIQNLISDRALAFYARQAGFEVTDEHLALALQSFLPPELFQNGKLVSREAYVAFLAQQNLTVPEFEETARNQLLLTRLTGFAVEGVVVSPADIEQAFRRKNEKIRIEYAIIKAEALKSKVSVSPAEVQAAYERDKARYQSPERRNALVFVAEESKVAALVTSPEAELRRLYEERKDEYRTPERVRVRHILLKTNDKKADEVPKIQKRIEDLLKQAKGGADFAELARKNSEDTVSAAKGGDLDWVAKGQTVPEFEKAAFSLKPGQLSDVVKTMYGFHILRLEAREDARLKPFDEVKAQLEASTKRQRVFDRMQAGIEQVRAALIKSPAEARKVAQANAITETALEKAAKGDTPAALGEKPVEFMESVFALQKGGVTGIAQLSANSLAVAQVTDVLPAHPAPLAEVEKRVREGVVFEKMQKLMTEKNQQGQKLMKTVNGDLAKLAQALGAELKKVEPFTRDGAVAEIGAAATLSEGFDREAGQLYGPISTAGGTIFCKVTEKIPADLSLLPASRNALHDDLKGTRARDRRELFAEGVLQVLIKEKKVKVHYDVIKRITASYTPGS